MWQNPCVTPYTAGMRVRDLIPNREALITPDYYQRKNQLVQFEQPASRPGRAGRISQDGQGSFCQGRFG